MDLVKYIDHTLLRTDATAVDIKKLCEEADEYGFYSVCVNPCWVGYCSTFLSSIESDVKVCSVIDFPLGAGALQARNTEAKTVLQSGAVELDMVINIGAIKANKDGKAKFEIEAVRSAMDNFSKKENYILKVILETCLLTNEEIIRACNIAKEAGADFVKTSTGFNKSGATAEDVALMRKTVGADMGVKASGGIRTYEDAIKMIDAGATRIGTSNGVKIIEGY